MGEREVLDQRFLKAGIAEGDVFQFHVSAQLGKARGFDFGSVPGDVFVLRVFHHILNALHLRPHFLNALSGADKRHGRGHEGTKESLEHQDCAEAEPALHRQPDADGQYRVARRRRKERRDHADVLIGEMGAERAFAHALAGSHHAVRADVERLPQHGTGERFVLLVLWAFPPVEDAPMIAALVVPERAGHRNGKRRTVFEELRDIRFEELQFFLPCESEIFQSGIGPFPKLHHGAEFYAFDAKGKREA